MVQTIRDQGWLRTLEATTEMRLALGDPLNAGTAVVSDVLGKAYRPGLPVLAWTYSATHLTPKVSGSLWSFLKLTDASDEAIIRYAKRWGPLGICACGRPYTHEDDCPPLGWEEFVWLDFLTQTPLSSESRAWCWEPLDAWRYYARRFRAVLHLVVAAREGRTPHPRYVLESQPMLNAPACQVTEDAVAWASMFEPYDDVRIEKFRSLLASTPSRSTQFYVTIAMQHILDQARITPIFFWNEDGATPRFDLTFRSVGIQLPPSRSGRPTNWKRGLDSLYTILSSQLAAVVMRPNNIGTCARCGSTFVAADGRGVRRDKNHYCERCKPQAARDWEKQAKRAQRERARLKTSSSAIPRLCARRGCANPLPTSHGRRRFCSDTCRVRHYQERTRLTAGIPAGTPTDTPTPTNASERT